MHAEFKAQLAQLAEAQLQEQQIAAENPAISFSYANFAAANRQRQENLEGSLREIEAQIDILKDEVAFCFQELKKYEIAVDTRLKKKKYEQHRVEQTEIDDLAIDMFRRRG
jgi:flagellar biosynthesis chaperone FliJ